MRCSIAHPKGMLMNNALTWLGIAVIIGWAILWLTVKIAAAAVHLLLLSGLVLIAWGLLRRFRRP